MSEIKYEARLDVHYDANFDFVLINGVLYPGSFFRDFASADPDVAYIIDKSLEGGVVITKL